MFPRLEETDFFSTEEQSWVMGSSRVKANVTTHMIVLTYPAGSRDLLHGLLLLQMLTFLCHGRLSSKIILTTSAWQCYILSLLVYLHSQPWPNSIQLNSQVCRWHHCRGWEGNEGTESRKEIVTCQRDKTFSLNVSKMIDQNGPIFIKDA